MINPVLKRELSVSLRSPRTFIALCVYVILMTVITAVAIFIMKSNILYSGFTPSSATNLYVFMGVFQLGIVMIFTTAFAGTAISGERERQTLDVMLVTKMSTLSIVLGKLTASLSMVCLIIVVSLPVFGIAMYFGGVGLFDVFALAFFTLSAAVMVGGIAIFFSSLLKRNVTSIILTYIAVGFLTIGHAVLLLAGNYIASVTVLANGSDALADRASNIFAISDVLLSFNVVFGLVSLFDTLIGSFSLQNIAYYSTIYTGYLRENSFTSMVWAFNIIFNLIVAAVFTLLASVVIKPVKNSRKYR
ncbi:MAG: hypothetical protein LBL35_08815 [Clostridiales bacterium]|nr:hypothetical protein [Clostridiales bacterium]